MLKFRTLIGTLSLLPFLIYSQNIVQGNVESVPDKTPAFARVTFTNTSNTSEQFITLTDINTGNYQLDIPAGTYERKVETQNHFLYKDNIAVNNSQEMNFQVIEDIGNTSTYHPNILNVLKTLTATLDGFPDPEVERFNDLNIPIQYFANNDSMPTVLRQYLDSASNDITTKSDGKVQFTEVFTQPEVGIVFRYRSQINMPCPGASACTFIDEYSPDMSVKHATIYISTDNPISQYNFVFRREFMRTMITGTYSLDPSFIQSFNAQTPVLHPDEGKALSIMYTLKHNTDMRGHKEIVIQDPVPVELTLFKAIKDDNIVKLLWNTATEVNNYGFEIERKKDKWENIGFVQGNGNSNSPKDYTYADTLKMPGIYFYRLKQSDNDGQFQYSPEIKINMEDIIKAYELMQNYPNPFNPETKIGFKIPERSNVKLTIYDVIGNTVSTLVDKQLEPGYYEEPFNGKNLSSGMYIYRLQTENSNVSGKMMLMK